MTPDSGIAIGLVGILFLFVTFPHLAEPFLEFYLSIGREVSTLLLLSAIAGAYFNHYVYTAIAATLLVAYVLPMMWTIYPRSDTRRLHRDIMADEARFDATKSIDLQFANGTAVHDSPNMLEKGKDNSPLLIFPPSKQVQEQLNG
jgi:hypothetical protein